MNLFVVYFDQHHTTNKPPSHPQHTPINPLGITVIFFRFFMSENKRPTQGNVLDRDGTLAVHALVFTWRYPGFPARSYQRTVRRQIGAFPRYYS